MDHKQKLLQAYHKTDNPNHVEQSQRKISPKYWEYLKYIENIASNSQKQKAVYTVLVTLLVHKILNPHQDIRYHQSHMTGGFSGRTVDTQYITPTLKELGLPSMSESGWLTRSLEQPHPYTLDYQGKISNKIVKESFLQLIDFIEKHPNYAEDILILILDQVKKLTKSNKISIIKIDNPEQLDVKTIINCLDKHFSFKYQTHGGSKLPVLAFFALYQQLINEVERYKLCTLETLKSHTSSDKRSKSAGDIEILDQNKNLIEAIEIKHGRNIDINMIRIAKEKIIAFNPRRYYIFSSNQDMTISETAQIDEEIRSIKQEHGCQVIVNGILPTIKYYLRLINSLADFTNTYSQLIERDKELNIIHKEKWNEILLELEGDL